MLTSRITHFLHSLLSELWTITRWGLLWVTAHIVRRLYNDPQAADVAVIRFGNLIFAARYTSSIYRDFTSYVKEVPADISNYAAIRSPHKWITGKRILDLGAGLGHYGKLLMASGATAVFSIEPNFRKSAFARQHAALGQTLLVGSACDIPLADSAVDTIFAHTVFEHISDVPRALHECARVLRPTGIILIAFNYYAHRGGHHLFPYIHFPWAPWIVSESSLCQFWAQSLCRDQARGGMQFYDQTEGRLSTLSGGQEICLNKMVYEDFERHVIDAGLVITARKSSEAIANLLPFLANRGPLRHFLTGTVFYCLEKTPLVLRGPCTQRN